MKKVWFVCVGNAGRSQMAQAFYERRGGEARSAVSRPETDIHQPVGEAMEEIGLDIWDRKPKPIRREDNVIVTMGCGDACPILPGKEYVDSNLVDPVGMPLEEVRELRSVIERRVEAL